jgi:diguanylate cyclase (GGDEF)-like protein
MINSRRNADDGPSGHTIVPILSSRLPGLVTLGVLFVLIWATGARLLYHTWHEREAAAFQLVDDQSREAADRIGQVLNGADQTLLAIRTRYQTGPGNLEPDRWAPADKSGGIALIEPDGHVVSASPHANTEGWPRLMTRLADSADVLAIGEPLSGKNGRPSLVPVARRLVQPDGSFAGILMYSLNGDTLTRVPLTSTALDGCMTLVDDESVVLARSPMVRGTIGVRITHSPTFLAAVEAGTGMGHRVSPLDGIDRIYAFRHLSDAPVSIITAVGYEAVFAGWETFRVRVLSLDTLATALIVLTGLFWYARRQRAEISAEALTVVLANIDHAVRVERSDGAVIAANETGLDLPEPDYQDMSEPGDGIHIDRHVLAGGQTVLIGTDATARQAAAARIEFLTNHDKLTGLPNRWRATARIQELIAEKSGSARVAALILFDLDGFQDINDTIGHEGGDEVLAEVAARLGDLVSDHDVVARLGGDEFLLFLEEPDDEAVVTCLTRHIPRILARPIAVRGQQVRLGASMGISFYPRDGADAATLFRHANIALSRAKMAGRGRAQSFDPAMMVSFEEHRMVESDLRRALDSDELELRLQPQFTCETLEVTGFEALTRWQHPTRGELSPATFIPIAERSGLINPLGLWAIEQACKAAASWGTRHRVAVNISPLQLRCETIQEDIRAILRRTQFPAHLLELEVTENVLLDEDQRTLEMLHKLRAMDIRITLDDFGTGYSSLSYLRRFPFDKIKIDKSFIQGQGTDRGTRVILEAMIRMCSDLGFDVVAEGVETEQQLNELRRLGCQEIQGYLLGVPLRPEAVEDFLISHARRSARVQTGTLTTT